eukprot:1676-Hanusia_phi.AAC.3
MGSEKWFKDDKMPAETVLEHHKNDFRNRKVRHILSIIPFLFSIPSPSNPLSSLHLVVFVSYPPSAPFIYTSISPVISSLPL